MTSDPVRVGVLFSVSGMTSTVGRSQLQGTLLAIEEINEGGGINGRELLPVIYDPCSDPKVYAHMAERLIVEDKVNVIFGCYMSSSRKAVLPIVERWNKLLFYPTIYEGFEFSRNIIYTGAAPNQNSVQLTEYMTSRFGGRVYMVGSDYLYPYESNRIMSELLLQIPGSCKLGEQYVPLTATEAHFAPIIEDIIAQQPDFIFSTVVGDATASLYRAYASAGLDPRRMPIASLTTSEAEVSQIGVSAAVGHFTAAPYFRSVDTEQNRRCLARLYGLGADSGPPNVCWEAAYFGIHLFANACRIAGDDAIDTILPLLLGSEFDAPQGRVKIDPRNHHTFLYPRIGKVAADGEFSIVQEASTAVAPDPYLVTHAFGDPGKILFSLEV